MVDKEFLETLEKRLSLLVREYMIPGVRRTDEKFWAQIMLSLKEIRKELAKL